MNQNISIAIHGGAGTILKSDMTPELEKAYLDGLKDAVNAGYAILQCNGTATEAVASAVCVLEDNVLFNAGRGSVFTKKGQHEMDASIMAGKDLAAGAVAGVHSIKNPVLLAKAIMQHSEHVMLCGDGALEFAINQQLELAPASYFFSEFRYNQWKSIMDTDSFTLDHNNAQIEQLMKNKKFGTVGAVACDSKGNLAAATSTGGMTNKRYNRVGDSPIIGAGNYANNVTCAISCTGHGELFIKAVAAYQVSCLMEYKNLNLQEAMAYVVHQKLLPMGGEGGMIGVDGQGNIVMDFNSAGMYRASIDKTGQLYTGIFG
jgi:beta-aspartyl-peptidase (threonine type)